MRVLAGEALANEARLVQDLVTMPSPERRWSSLQGLCQPSAFQVSALLAIGVALVAHFWNLHGVPSGFFVDEAGIAYSATGIALDGRDEHGAAWPLYFQSFGDWKNPITIYATALVFKLFGGSIELARAVPSVFSLLTAVLAAELSRRAFASKWLALGVFTVGALEPALLDTGRTAFEVSAQPAFVVLFLLLWFLADRTDSARYAAAAGVALAGTAYAYSTGRLFMPLLVLGLVAAYWPWRRGRLVAICGLTAMLLWVPAVVWNQAHQDALSRRFALISIFNVAHSPGEIMAAFWRVYTSDFSPSFLFYSSWFRQGGELFASQMPLIALGLVVLYRLRADPFWRLVAIGLLVAPIPAALTSDFGHPLRALDGVPFWLLIGAAGAHHLGLALSPEQRWILAGLAAMVLLEACSFLADYLSTYPARISQWNEQGLEQAVGSAVSATATAPANGQLAVSDQIFGGDIFVPYFAKEDLRLYRRSGMAGMGARVLPVASSVPAGTVWLTKAGERPRSARRLDQIELPTTDGFGRTVRDIRYVVWMSA